MKKYLAEFIGTFALIFCGTGAIVIDNITGGAVGHLGISLTFGLIVTGMIYSVGDISGAHLNPAVTIGFAVSGLFPVKNILPYILVQCLGGICASLALKGLFPSDILLGATMPKNAEMQSFWLEMILTFILMVVIIRVATGSKETGVLAGLAIGGIVALEAAFGGPICGASMNPARSFAPALVSGHLEHIWIYLTAPFVGAGLAVGVHRLLK